MIGSLAFVVIAAPALFIAVKCYGHGTQPARKTLPAQTALAGAGRDESRTYLTLPEWFIVYNAEEYASFIRRNAPSGFPYFASARQFWSYYGGVCHVTKREYAFESSTHVMLAVIGASFTIENVLKGLYENTVGRLAEWAASHDTPEDALAARTALEYGRFLHTVPWYQFPFATKVAQLWRETPLWGPHVVRKWERRVALTLEYGTKAGYGWVIRRATQTAYGADDLEIHTVVEGTAEAVFADQRVRKLTQVGPETYIVVLPRYEPFTRIVLNLVEHGVRFVDIAGNDEILLTALAPRHAKYSPVEGRVVLRERVLTEPDQERIAVRTPVRSLPAIVWHLQASGAKVEHLYDY